MNPISSKGRSPWKLKRAEGSGGIVIPKDVVVVNQCLKKVKLEEDYVDQKPDPTLLMDTEKDANSRISTDAISSGGEVFTEEYVVTKVEVDTPSLLMSSGETPGPSEGDSHDDHGTSSSWREEFESVKCTVRQLTSLVEKQNDVIKKQEDTIKKQDEMIKKQDEAFEKQDEAIKKQDEVLKKQNYVIKKHVKTIKKQDEAFKKQDEAIKKQDEVLKKQNDVIKKHVKTIKKQDEAFKKQDEMIKKQEKAFRKHAKATKKQNDVTKNRLRDLVCGQEKRKKIKVGASLAGGGKRKKNGDGGAGDNLPAPKQNPFLNELVMEVVFKQFSLLNHDESPKSALGHLAELRLVCKAWNHEIGKIIRKETRISVNTLVSAYPKGLGWKATTPPRKNRDNKGFKYSAPMPEAIGTFQNLTVKIKNCNDFTETSIVKWFQVMGSSVKSLQLTCSLRCYHQNRFVEKILKKWCPNLRSFTLEGAQCLESLIQHSLFGEPSLENQCKSLKEFILFSGYLHQSHFYWSRVCGLRIEDLETPGHLQFQDVHVKQQIFDNRSTFVKHLVNYVEKAGEPATSIAQEDDLLNKLVRRPIGLTSLDGMTPLSFGSHVVDFFQEKFSCDPGFDIDGGIFGQLMKMARVEKLVIREPDWNHEWIFNELFAIFLYRTNLWSSSLQHFECLGHCPPLTAQKIFATVGFPLKKLKIVGGCVAVKRVTGTAGVEPECMERILCACAETLEELELGLGDNVCRRQQITLPVLPKLKVLIVENKVERVVKVTSQDILIKLPKLERCVLTLGRHGSWPATSFFGGGADVFWRDGGRSHPLKELKLLDEYVVENDIDWLVMCFPTLKIVDFLIGHCGVDFKAFWEKMGELPLEQVRILFAVKLKRDMADDLYPNAIRDNIEGFKELRWLELVHDGQHRFPLTSKLAEGFAKATKLRLLRFTNFEVGGNMAQEIKETLSHAVVQLPLIRTSEARWMKRKK